MNLNFWSFIEKFVDHQQVQVLDDSFYDKCPALCLFFVYNNWKSKFHTTDKHLIKHFKKEVCVVWYRWCTTIKHLCVTLSVHPSLIWIILIINTEYYHDVSHTDQHHASVCSLLIISGFIRQLIWCLCLTFSKFSKRGALSTEMNESKRHKIFCWYWLFLYNPLVEFFIPVHCHILYHVQTHKKLLKWMKLRIRNYNYFLTKPCYSKTILLRKNISSYNKQKTKYNKDKKEGYQHHSHSWLTQLNN